MEDINEELKKILEKNRNPLQEQAEKRRDTLVEQAKLNEAIKVIDSLLSEVNSMNIPIEKFSPDKKAFNEAFKQITNNNQLNPLYTDFNEQDYKKNQLQLDLEDLKRTILLTITKMGDIVMDMEATKIENFSPKE